MSIQVIEDLASAFGRYPMEYLDLEVYVRPSGYDGSKINVGEEVEFSITAWNKGPINMKNPSFRVVGLNGTEVKSNGPSATWGSYFDVSGEWYGDLPSHYGRPVTKGYDVETGEYFKFRPAIESEGDESIELVKVMLLSWDADNNHMLKVLTNGFGASPDIFSSPVEGD